MAKKAKNKKVKKGRGRPSAWKPRIVKTTILVQRHKVIRLLVGCSMRSRLSMPIGLKARLDIVAPEDLNPKDHSRICRIIRRHTVRGNVAVCGKYPRMTANGDPVLAYRILSANVVVDINPQPGHDDRRSVREIKWLTPQVFMIGYSYPRADLIRHAARIRQKGKTSEGRKYLAEHGFDKITADIISATVKKNPQAKRYIMLDSGTFDTLNSRKLLHADSSLPSVGVRRKQQWPTATRRSLRSVPKKR